MSKPLIVDAHEDLAYNALILGRDYSRSVGETRHLERGLPFIAQRDNTMLGWPEYQKGQVSLIFSTLFALPAAHESEFSHKTSYRDFNEARQVGKSTLLLNADPFWGWRYHSKDENHHVFQTSAEQKSSSKRRDTSCRTGPGWCCRCPQKLYIPRACKGATRGRRVAFGKQLVGLLNDLMTGTM